MTTNPNELQRAIELSEIERQAREDHELQEALNRSRGDIPQTAHDSQFQEAMRRSMADIPQTAHDPQFQEAMRRSMADIPEEDDEATLQAVIEASRNQYFEDAKRRHNQHRPSSNGGPAQRTSPSTSNSWSNGGPAQATQSSSAKAINSEIDRAYNDSIAIDRKKEEDRIAAEQAAAAAEARVQARKIEDQRFIAEFTPQYLNDGDVTIRFEHNGRTEDVKVKVSTPIDLLLKYASSKYYLDNVTLLFVNRELLPGTILSDYVQKGARVKIIIQGDSPVGGFKVRNSRRNKINIRKNSKRQNRQNSKRQDRQNSKRQDRQNSKRQDRQNSKRQNSKRQNRQNSKRQNRQNSKRHF
jgi:hypothetical protein